VTGVNAGQGARRSAAHQRVGHARQPRNRLDIVDAHDIRAARDPYRHGCQGAFHALVGGQVEGVPNEGLARGSQQDGEAQGAYLVQPADEFQVLRHTLAETDAGVEQDVFLGNAGTPGDRDRAQQFRLDLRQQVLVRRGGVGVPASRSWYGAAV